MSSPDGAGPATASANIAAAKVLKSGRVAAVGKVPANRKSLSDDFSFAVADPPASGVALRNCGVVITIWFGNAR